MKVFFLKIHRAISIYSTPNHKPATIIDINTSVARLLNTEQHNHSAFELWILSGMIKRFFMLLAILSLLCGFRNMQFIIPVVIC